MSSRNVLVVLFVGLIVVGSIATYQQVLLSAPANSATTVTSTVTIRNTTEASTATITNSTAPVGNQTIGSTTNGTLGLELTLSLNATRLSVGQGLRVNVSLWNTLSRLNLVNASDDWPFQGIPVALWPPCYATFYPAQQAAAHSANSTGAVVAVVLEGYYTMANISIAADVYFPIDCTGNWIMSNTTLQPMSSVANVTGASSVFRTNETLGPFLLSSSFTVGGYWNLLNNSQLQNTPVINAQALGPEPYPQSPEASAFVPGSYTIAIADEWGQAVILHFDVA